MRITKEYIESAHAKGCYVDRLDGTVYPAVPRTTFLNAVNDLTITRHKTLNYCQADICYCGHS